MAELKVCYSLTPQDLKSSPICPHCRFSLEDKAKNVAGQMEQMEDLMHQLEELPPMDESSFKAKISDIVSAYTKGKDNTKLRIVVKRGEE